MLKIVILRQEIILIAKSCIDIDFIRQNSADAKKKDSRKFKSWMFTILRNHFLKWQRKKASVQTDAFEDGIDYLSQLESVSLQQDVAAAYENKVEAETVQSILNKLPERYRAVLITWKTAVPVLLMAALVLVLLLNPFSGHLQTVDEVVAYSLANHLDTTMEMAFQAGEVRDVGQWFSQRLGYSVHLPDLKNLGLNLRGGRKCTLGKIDAAYLFCQSKGKPVSLFVINQNDVAVPFGRERKYIVEEGESKVTLWEESGMVYAMVI